MKRLSSDALQRAKSHISLFGRTLEQIRLNVLIHGAPPSFIVEHLQVYQNLDGGFGHGLEPDMTLPSSSSICTSVAFNILDEIPSYPVDPIIMTGIIRYLENTYDDERGGWCSAPREVNEYPHAPWWHWKDGGTAIDACWANPTAELAGALFEWRDLVQTLDPMSIVDRVIEYVESKESFDSFHEVYSILRMARRVPNVESRVLDAIGPVITSMVAVEWDSYVPEPRHFLMASPASREFIDDVLVESNLDHLVDMIERDGSVQPNWEWSGYPEQWDIAKRQWSGILTFDALRLLKTERRL